MERLRLLEDYCQQLIRADQKISTCDVVIAFFTPSSSDLNPSFPQESLVILPSEVREQGKEQPKQLPQPPASEPIVSQMYLCIEDYETKDTKNRVFKVNRNERLGVLIKESSGWWLVENEEKRVAWFPAPFLKALEIEDVADCGTDSNDEGIRYYAAVAYEAMSWDELSISRGVLVEVIEKSNNGWWLIRYNGKTGYVPAMYLKPYRNCHQRQILLNPGNFPSTSNLFKASSQLDLSRPVEAWRAAEEPNIANTGNPEWVSCNKLDRRKSRSISGLYSTTPYGFQPSPAVLQPRYQAQKAVQSSGVEENDTTKIPKRDNISDPSVAFDNKKSPVKPHRPQMKAEERDLDSSKASSTAVPLARQTNSPLAPGSPCIPQRPRGHEILHKCTTVTKKAWQTKEAMKMQC
ncbi:putative neutrophil cytosol factor 1C isoform X2 [Hyperolius riggenbachi]